MDKNQIRKRRKKKRARRVFIIKCVLVLVMIGIPVCFVAKHNLDEKRKAEEIEKANQLAELKKEEEAKVCFDAIYQEKFEESIAEWVFENYDESEIERLKMAAGDSGLTESEIYEVFGESIYVVRDRYLGYLSDEETAKKQGIYFRDGKSEGSVEIAVAGDLCLAEDGFVLDHYDTVNELSQCISPEILNILNQADLFYVNHEYCISDRGTPLE